MAGTGERRKQGGHGVKAKAEKKTSGSRRFHAPEPPKLADLGITYNEASQWQKLAEGPGPRS